MTVSPTAKVRLGRCLTSGLGGFEQLLKLLQV